MSVVQLGEQLSKLRADIVAGKHPRFHVPEHLKAGLSAPTDHFLSRPALPNGLNAHAPGSSVASAPVSTDLQKPSISSKPNQAPRSAGSPDAKVVLQEKRRELERMLEEQIQHKKALAKLKPHDLEVVADFDVTETLRKAHELVKPYKQSDVANHDESSSDSFDENTFYSSQMNSTSSAEEMDTSKKTWQRPQKACRFFRDGKPCPYGEKCTFSHDPAIVKRVEFDEEPKPNGRAQEQANRKAPSPQPRRTSARIANQTQVTQAAKIADLEDQLRQLKESQKPANPANPAKPAVVPRAIEREPEEVPEPREPQGPNIDEFGRDRSRREVNGKDLNGVPVRVIRNTIASPYAPQPARVSPFTVARLPHEQPLEPYHNQVQSWEGSDINIVTAQQSPQISVSKKRRRVDPGNDHRNVIPRREQFASPLIRVKDEPVSPPPPNYIPNHRQLQQVPQYIEGPAPNSQARYSFDSGDGPYVQAPTYQEPRPLTPQSQSNVSRNEQRRATNGDIDLRRVVSTRNMRPPQSPELYDVQHSNAQSHVVRAASQVQYVPNAERPLPPPQYRASVQPQLREPRNSIQDRQIPLSPTRRASVAMPPPSRRIVVDQYGNRYMEAPVPTERSLSMAPKDRHMEFNPNNEFVTTQNTYQQAQPILVDERGRYVQQFVSPTSPQFAEYSTPPKKRRIIQLDQDEADEIAFDNESRYVQYEPRAEPRYEMPGVREHVQGEGTLQSRYEPEHVSRVSSVRPQQPRIIRLGEHRDNTPNAIRQMSVRPEAAYSRPTQHKMQQDGLYQYAPQEEEQRDYEDMHQQANGAPDQRRVCSGQYLHGSCYKAEVKSLDEAMPKDRPVLIIITSSYEGEPPDNGGHFVRWVHKIGDKTLEGVQYAVFGYGNRE
ncbi:uncharacterized protein KY384_007394 [Bacidia gigantensis]|uniref:uncharacterized protein n=1 Tax=Bacidia gigantensis TaxID=2732470 RepID=UPI001D04757D|nr:uncharacterized protein KY384_007394 [Bacidia gigantensis]KAG8528476.1 hypothetical protein KY384_007394 [Bacidia gigantensis]